MSETTMKTIVVFGLAVGAMVASGRDLLWTGNGSTDWNLNTSSTSWKDRSNDSATYFATGDNVLFDDTLMPSMPSSASLVVSLTPGDVTFNIANAFTLSSGGYNFFSASRIVKTGAGTLTWHFGSSNSGYTTPVEVNGGVLIFDNPNAFAGYVPTQNNALREYVINNGGELRVTARNCFGKCDLYTLSGAGGGCVRLKKGGKFSLYLPDKSSHVGSSVWDLYLEGGMLDFQAKGAQDSLGLLLINHKLSVSGDTAYVITNTPGFNYQHLAINKTTSTIFDIADVTGDDEPDLTLDLALTQNPGGTPQVIKQGPGTMRMLYRNSLFKSDMVIKEGTVSCDYHDPNGSEFGNCTTTVFGDMTTAGRTITVQDTGRLEFLQRNIFTSYGGGVTGGNTIATEVVVTNGGTLMFNAPCNFGPLTVVDGNLVFADVNFGWGAISVRGTMKVRGRTPVTLQRRGSQCRQILYREYATIFDVADVTDNAEPDFITELPFVMPDYADYNTDSTTGEKYPYGFVKTGAGTMAIKGNNNASYIDMNGEVRVTEGTLEADGDIRKTSATVVSAGAYLAGTGVVSSVQIAAGGGFRGTAGQTIPLKMTGNLTIGANPVIRIDNLGGLASDKVRAKLFTVLGTVTGVENLNDATVYLDNAVWGRGKYMIEYSAGTRTLSIKGVKGTTLIFK